MTIEEDLRNQISDLLLQNERLKEDKTNLETSVNNLVAMYEDRTNELKQLQAEKAELLEALKKCYGCSLFLRYTPEEINDEEFVRNILSKHEAK